VARLLRERRDVRMAVLDTSLPLPLLERLGEIRKRLGRWLPGRLRRAEREQVLVRQCETWAEAVKSGTPVAALLQEPLRTQVRTARNEQLQRRGWLSRGLRRCRQGVLWALLGSGVLYGVLWIRLALLRPSAAGGDPLEALDRQTRAIPAEQRAWPLVKRFWESQTGTTNTRWQLGLSSSAWVAGPTDPNWPAARAEMETYSDESWDLLLQASRKPKLGYLFRDGPDPQVQLSTVMVATSFSRWQARQFSIALHLLQGEAHRSLENTDPDRAVELALAVLRLARLASDADNHPSVIQLGDNGSFEVLALMGTLCQTRQLSAAALVRLRDALLESPPAALPPRVDVEQLLIENLDRMYSSGENGAVTRQGLEILWSESLWPGGVVPVLGWLMWPADQPWAQRILSPEGQPVLPLGPVLAPVMVRRGVARNKIARMVAAAQEWADPNADPQAFLDRLRLELAELKQRPWSQCRHAPVIVTLQSSLPVLADLLAVPLDPRPREAAEGAMAVRLGLELYRLRTGALPETLEALVPRDLPALPPDPYDRQPMKVRRLNDRMWLYSVGEDGQDDTARWDIAVPQKPIHPKDLRLLEVTGSLSPPAPAP
jgi:hypothetical protein